MMNEEKKPTPLTRGELFPILGGVYLLIAFPLLGVARHDSSTLMLTADFILFGAAIGLSVVFSIWGLREKWRGRRKEHTLADPGAAADRPRDYGPPSSTPPPA
jgi:hypothetical protein